MATYIVTSDRLIWPRDSVIDTIDLQHSNIDALIAGGHLSTHKVIKPAKTKLIQTEE